VMEVRFWELNRMGLVVKQQPHQVCIVNEGMWMYAIMRSRLGYGVFMSVVRQFGLRYLRQGDYGRFGNIGY